MDGTKMLALMLCPIFHDSQHATFLFIGDISKALPLLLFQKTKRQGWCNGPKEIDVPCLIRPWLLNVRIYYKARHFIKLRLVWLAKVCGVYAFGVQKRIATSLAKGWRLFDAWCPAWMDLGWWWPTPWSSLMLASERILGSLQSKQSVSICIKFLALQIIIIRVPKIT